MKTIRREIVDMLNDPATGGSMSLPEICFHTALTRRQVHRVTTDLVAMDVLKRERIDGEIYYRLIAPMSGKEYTRKSSIVMGQPVEEHMRRERIVEKVFEAMQFHLETSVGLLVKQKALYEFDKTQVYQALEELVKEGSVTKHERKGVNWYMRAKKARPTMAVPRVRQIKKPLEFNQVVDKEIEEKVALVEEVIAPTPWEGTVVDRKIEEEAVVLANESVDSVLEKVLPKEKSTSAVDMLLQMAAELEKQANEIQGTQALRDRIVELEAKVDELTRFKQHICRLCNETEQAS
jgi:hypothetical protein